MLKDKILKNENYEDVPEPEYRKPTDILGNEPMYRFAETLEKLKFLTEPQNRQDMFIQ